MKKIFAAFLALAMLTALCACAPAEEENPSLPKSGSVPEIGGEYEVQEEEKKPESNPAPRKTAEEELADFLNILEVTGIL